MGYNTTYNGQLFIETQLSDDDHNVLNSLLGADIRDHPEWGDTEELTYIDLELSYDYCNAIVWDGSEKSYDMAKKINLLTRVMRQSNPDFKLSGMFKAICEDYNEEYMIVLDENGIAFEKNYETLYQKYIVKRSDGEGDPYAEYFVLRVDKGSNDREASLEALKTYANMIKETSNQLYTDIMKRYFSDDN